MLCPSCGSANPGNHKFCWECGTRLQPQPPPAPQAYPDPLKAQELLEKAFSLSDQGRLEEAISTCQQATEANPDSTSAHSLLGILYERKGEKDKAIQQYQKVLALSPGSTADRIALSRLKGEPEPEPPGPASRRLARVVLLGGFSAAMLALGLGILLVLRQPAPVSATQGPPLLFPPMPMKGVAVPGPGLGAVYPPLPAPAARPLPAAPLSDEEERALTRPRAQRPSVSIRPIPPIPEPVPTVALPRVRVERAAPPAPAPAPPPPPPAKAAPQSLGEAEAHAAYLRGEYSRAVAIYQGLANRPDAPARVHQYLALSYQELGRKDEAAAHYRKAIERFQQEVEKGQDQEEARLGIRSCEAALKALEER